MLVSRFSIDSPHLDIVSLTSKTRGSYMLYGKDLVQESCCFSCSDCLCWLP